MKTWMLLSLLAILTVFALGCNKNEEKAQPADTEVAQQYTREDGE